MVPGNTRQDVDTLNVLANGTAGYQSDNVKHIIMCGDFNARTAEQPDYVINDIQMISRDMCHYRMYMKLIVCTCPSYLNPFYTRCPPSNNAHVIRTIEEKMDIQNKSRGHVSNSIFSWTTLRLYTSV